jgi:heme a synthase
MTSLRRLGYVALAIAFAQIVFGAIVRISGSGLGCGDHWPKCNGAWIPHFTGSEVIIEVSHRYGALAVSLAVLALAVLAFAKRDQPGVGGRGGALRSAVAAIVLIVLAAVLGAVTVKLELPPQAVVLHLTLAMLLLIAIAATVVRAGGFNSASITPGSSARTARGALAAMIIALVVVALGGLTANIPGGLSACRGFPHCAMGMESGPGLHVHLTHRVLAILLLFHTIGLVIGITRRQELSALRTASRVALTVLLAQVSLGVMLVSLLPTPALRSLHQAVGTGAFLSLVVLALLARRGRVAPAEPPAEARAPQLAGGLP